MTVPQSSNAIDPEQAAAIFAEFAEWEDLALRFPADGCYARTHLMVRRLVERGLVASKIWAFAASESDLLWTDSPNNPDERVRWQYHVAPVVPVRETDGLAREMVFDPILFNGHVTVDEWLIALHDTPTVVRTAIGQPPLPALGGSGYWPSADPLDGPDDHAAETLEKYRRWTE